MSEQAPRVPVLPGGSGSAKSGLTSSSVTHDLNNLLTVIRGRAEMVLANESLSPQGRESVQQIVSAIDRAAQLTRGLATGSSHGVAERQADGEKSAAPDPRDRISATVLLVVHDQGLRRFVSLLLQRLGCDVSEAATEVEVFQIWDAPTQKFDLLVTEVAAPAGAGGWELVKRLRAKNPGLSAIVLRDSSDPADPEIGAGNERVQILNKPFTPEALVRAVRGCLQSN